LRCCCVKEPEKGSHNGRVASCGSYVRHTCFVSCPQVFEGYGAIKRRRNSVTAETGSYQYIGCIDTADCSAILDLDLQSNDWDYSVSVPGAGSFIATAQRTGGPDAGRRWEMTESDDSPTCLNGDLCP